MTDIKLVQALENATIAMGEAVEAFNDGGRKKGSAEEKSVLAAKKAFKGALHAAGASDAIGQQIWDALKENGFQYNRDVMNGPQGYATKGWANQLDQATVHGMQSLTALVGRGAVLDADGTRASHEPARRELAYMLQNWSKGSNSREELGLKKGESLDIIHGDKVDHQQLDKALRAFQRANHLTQDGRVGTNTLNKLLYMAGADPILSAPERISHRVYAKDGGYICGTASPCDLQTYKDGTDKDKAADARKQATRNAIGEVRDVIEGLGGKLDAAALKGLSATEIKALQALYADPDGKGPKKATIVADGNLTADEIKAFQNAFGLESKTGIIGRETVNALAQINIRVAADQPIDPSDIRAAVATQSGHTAPKARQ